MTTRYIIKRDGTRVPFDASKITKAIRGANSDEPREGKRLTKHQINYIANEVSDWIFKMSEMGREIGVEDIQDKVEEHIYPLSQRVYDLFHDFRAQQSRKRHLVDLDSRIETIVLGTNAAVGEENSNKNQTIISTQRDLIAGELSKDYARRKIMTKDIMDAHDEGIIHVHDMDYMIHKGMVNCSPINIQDMLDNGTVLSGTMIETPKSFATATTVVAQISGGVAASQYGGQTVSLAHLAPYVDVSRQKIRKRIAEDIKAQGLNLTQDQINELAEVQVKREVADGCQTLQYQWISLQTTNGQAPFVTAFMYLNEAPEGQTRDDLALIIETMLEQRIAGIKNQHGNVVSAAFPKLIYVLQDDNVHPDTKYYYLTELAAKCTAYRMVPDYISEKIMTELKGETYPIMGCIDGNEVITYKYNNKVYNESISRAWSRIGQSYPAKLQQNGTDLYRVTTNMTIWDSERNEFVECNFMNRNLSENWIEVTLSNGRAINVTDDHPFETINRGVVLAKNLTTNDQIKLDTSGPENTDSKTQTNELYAWNLGLTLCDGSYNKQLTTSITAIGEDEIAKKHRNAMRELYGLTVEKVFWERGEKGAYIELRVQGDLETRQNLMNHYKTMFGGTSKRDRQIPNEVFSWDRNARAAFLGGMIDANGYINNTAQTAMVQIESTNHELAKQQMLLAQSLNMPVEIYRNHYSSKKKDAVRLRVEFVPSDELLSHIVSKKKTQNTHNNNSIRPKDGNVGSVIKTQPYYKRAYSYDVTTESEHFTFSGVYSHNCRAILTPDRFTPEGLPHKYYGRFNQGVVTINLPMVALDAQGDQKRFWKLLGERLDLIHKALRIRHEQLLGTKSDIAPLLWQDGAYARLKPGEVIDPLLYGGYSTISLGYAGIAETVQALIGQSHTTQEGRELALQIMEVMNAATAKWRAAENIDYSVYGTPMESATAKFAKALQNKHGVIKNVSDKSYITNSYHVHVTEQIDAFSKLYQEAKFQELSPGGAISYVETPNMTHNIDAVLSIMKAIYETIMYAELNTKLDLCNKCGYVGEIESKLRDGMFIWVCPKCGNDDKNTLTVTRRSCGYIGSNFWNQGRTGEIHDRVEHVDISC